MAIKRKLARRAAKSTAKHTAKGTVAKLARSPVRSTTLLLVGGTLGFLAGRSGRPSFGGSEQG